MTLDGLLTTSEVMKLLRIKSRTTLHEYVKAGRVEGWRNAIAFLNEWPLKAFSNVETGDIVAAMKDGARYSLDHPLSLPNERPDRARGKP